jgi:hypothetical protein
MNLSKLKWPVFALALTVALSFNMGCDDDDDNGNGTGPGAPDTLEILSGVYLDDMTLTNDKTYLLRGGVFIGDEDDQSKSTSLTIEPGTAIYGESATDGMLVITRGGQIFAQGTADNPIVMTSDLPVGQRARGQWGGLIICGWAPINTGDEAEGEGGTGLYGGTDPHDNSGIVTYVRVEFAGREITPDNELNGIALQGVGDATIIDYIQVHMNQDDGIEFFGGTINAKHVYITGCADDQFDWTDGWTGKGQFWVCQQYGDDADQGIEADNNADNNSAIPRSHPHIYNVTLVGDERTGPESDIGMLLREGTAAVIHNAIVMNFGDCGIDIDHEETFTNAWSGSGLSGELVVDHSIFWDNHEDWQTGETGDHDESQYPFTTQEFIETYNTNNRFADPGLMNPYSKTNPNFSPAAGSIALDGYAQPPNDGFFDQVNFVGGVGPSDNWIQGWTTAATN